MEVTIHQNREVTIREVAKKVREYGPMALQVDIEY
jgi:hypothetical protein